MIPLGVLGAATPRAGGGGGGGYLYFRIQCTANNGGSLDQITEIEVAQTAGGTNVCTGGTATASNQYTDYGPVRAFDGVKNDNYYAWVGTGAKPYWVQYQFVSPVAIAEVRLWGPSVSSIWNRGPKDFTIEGSNDGTNWTVLKTVTGDIYTAEYQQKTHAIP